MNKYTFYVTYQDRELETGERRICIEVDNEDIKTEKLAFQYCVMKAYEKRYKHEGVYKIELASIE